LAKEAHVLEVTPEHYSRLITIGRESTCALNDRELARRPENDRLSSVYGAIRFEDLGETAGRLHQRNVTVFGQVGRPLVLRVREHGRLALLADSGRLGTGQVLTHDDSVSRTRFIEGHAQFPAATRGVRALRRSSAWHTRPKKTLSCPIRPT